MTAKYEEIGLNDALGLARMNGAIEERARVIADLRRRADFLLNGTEQETLVGLALLVLANTYEAGGVLA